MRPTLRVRPGRVVAAVVPTIAMSVAVVACSNATPHANIDSYCQLHPSGKLIINVTS